MLISPRETIAECVEKINEEYFYVPAHQTIYSVLVDLWNAGQAIDLITKTLVDPGDPSDEAATAVLGAAAFLIAASSADDNPVVPMMCTISVPMIGGFIGGL